MGLLGLQSIEYLSRNRTVCLSYVNIPPPNDYSFAIGVINIVSWLVHLLEHSWSSNENLSYPLLTHFSYHPCNFDEFFRLFELVVSEWNDYWLAQQANIMQFEQLSKKFRNQLLLECQQWRPIQKGFATLIL